MKLRLVMLLNQIRGTIAMFFGRIQAKEFCKSNIRYKQKCSTLIIEPVFMCSFIGLFSQQHWLLQSVKVYW